MVRLPERRDRRPGGRRDAGGRPGPGCRCRRQRGAWPGRRRRRPPDSRGSLPARRAAAARPASGRLPGRAGIRVLRRAAGGDHARRAAGRRGPPRRARTPVRRVRGLEVAPAPHRGWQAVRYLRPALPAGTMRRVRPGPDRQQAHRARPAVLLLRSAAEGMRRLRPGTPRSRPPQRRRPAVQDVPPPARTRLRVVRPGRGDLRAHPGRAGLQGVLHPAGAGLRSLRRAAAHRPPRHRR